MPARRPVRKDSPEPSRLPCARRKSAPPLSNLCEAGGVVVEWEGAGGGDGTGEGKGEEWGGHGSNSSITLCWLGATWLGPITQEHLEMLRQYLELAKAAVPKTVDN